MPGPGPQMVELFFGLCLYLPGRCCKNFLSAKGHAQGKSGPGITCLVSVTIYCTNDLPGQFWRTKHLKKKRKMLIEQIIEIELRGPGPPGRTCNPVTDKLHDKTKILKENLRVDYYLPLKYYRRQWVFLPLTWTKSPTIKILPCNA